MGFEINAALVVGLSKHYNQVAILQVSIHFENPRQVQKSQTRKKKQPESHPNRKCSERNELHKE